MPVTEQDARAIAYLAARIRTETGGTRWDQPGIDAIVGKYVGRSLVAAVERVTRHAADPEAKTPGAILRPFVPAGVAIDTPPQPPRKHEACRVCGRHVESCLCERPATRAPEPSTRHAEHIAAARRQLRGVLDHEQPEEGR